MIKPYYQDDYATIYHGDCLEILPQLPKADLVLTDPPYGLNKFNEDKLNLDWFYQLKGPLIFTPGIANMFFYPKPDWVMCWYKPASTSRTRYGFNCWEPIYLYRTMSSTKSPDVIVQPVSKQLEAEGHPTPKPYKLFCDLIKQYSIYNNLVIDPFLGSGTTLRAAKDLQRKSIGIEIEEKYCEIAAKRLNQEVLPFVS